MKIAVDFDGTCVDHRFPAIGQEAPHCIAVLHELINNGHFIFLNTMRYGYALQDAVLWFKKHGLFLSGIKSDPTQTEWTQSRKCYGELYIDDAALGCPLIFPETFKRPCVDWSEVSKILTSQGILPKDKGNTQSRRTP